MRHTKLYITYLLLAISSICFGANRNTADGRLEVPSYNDSKNIILRDGYCLQFNRETVLCDWVAWRLTANELANEVASRKGVSFEPDPLLPYKFQAEYGDYSNSGYSRGHMAPAADMKYSKQAMYDCFYMSNICPQLATVNQGIWDDLEKSCRRWAKSDGEIYIVCGPIYRSQRYTRVGREHKMAVPDAFFKVILSLKKGDERAIGFIIDNANGNKPLEDCAVSVDKVEQITHFDFFPSLPDRQEKALESTFDINKWNLVKPNNSYNKKQKNAGYKKNKNKDHKKKESRDYDDMRDLYNTGRWMYRHF